MPQCAAVRNKTSFDQCPSDALKGVNLCGRHARAKDPILWVTRNQPKILRFTKVQALYRGWCVRKVLSLAGPGVLKRKDCVNDEELVTTESKDRQHPFEYFGLEEAGKVWWFDFGTLWEWSIRSVTPTNPYTKMPIDHSVLARLRRLHLHRRRNRMNVPAPSKDMRENITRRWTVLTHIFRSYGFEDVHPEQFANLTHTHIRTMFRIFMDDLELMPKPNHRIIALCSKGWLSNNQSNLGYMINSLNLLTIGLTDSRSYDIVFLLLSALYRC